MGLGVLKGLRGRGFKGLGLERRVRGGLLSWF